MTETWTCPHHGTEIPNSDTEGCPECIEWFAHRPDADTMMPAEREAEMMRLGGKLTTRFSLIHNRIEQLVGRPVWTHEMAGETAWSKLVKEAGQTNRGKLPSPEELLDPLTHRGKDVVVVGV